MENSRSDSESGTEVHEMPTRLMINGLHLRSAPGACVLFSGLLLFVGIAVAVVGYWQHGGRRPAPHRLSSGRTPSEKLKLVGPIIMGAGLFVFLCAGTLLYENRDRRQKTDPQAEHEDRGRVTKRGSWSEANTNTYSGLV